MSQARRARSTNAQPQYSQHASSYPPPQASGYPPPHAPHGPHGHAPQGPYAAQQQGYSGYPQPGYPQQYPQQHYAQQPYPQQPAPHYAQQYPYAPPPAPYAQQHYAQPPQTQPYPQAHAAQPAPQPIYGNEREESGVHPADLEGRTIVRPSFGKKLLTPVPSVAPVAPIEQAPAQNANANAPHNDTVIAISPFADPFAAARLQPKSDPPPQTAASLAETRIQNVDPSMFPGAAPSPQPQVVGIPAGSNAQVAQQPHHGAMAFAPTTALPQMPLVGPAAGAPAAASPRPSTMASPRPGSVAPQHHGYPQHAQHAQPKASMAPSPSAKIAAMNLRGIHGIGSVGNVDLSKMNKFAGRFGAGMVPVMGVGAIVFAALFDILFVRLPFHFPMMNRLWYITTALAFALAGYGSSLMTKAGKGFVFTTAVVVAILYGAADIGIMTVLEGATVSGSLFLAVQGVGIGIVCGIGAALKGFAQRP